MEYTSPEKIKNELHNLTKSNSDKAREMLLTIINKLPIEYRELIESSFIYKRVPKEYMLSSILFTISTATGLTFYLEALGYRNYANLYLSIIGSRGDAKTEAMKIATKPIKMIDDTFYNDHLDDVEMSAPDDDTPKRKQVLVQNASIEAAHKIHSDNPNSIGIMIDEIYALIEKMGNPNSRDGIAWRNFLLEGYTNGYIDISRKTTESFRINESCPTLLGGLQHQFIPKLIANGNLESGFIDRQLFTPKLTSNSKLQKGKADPKIIDSYTKSIKNILDYKIQSEKPEEDIKQFEIKITDEAHQRLFDYTQELINRQALAKPIIKEYMSKMQISVHKLCINVFMMFNASNSEFRFNVLSLENVELAIELNEYYLMNFRIILEDNIDSKSIEPSIEDIINVAKKNNASQKAVAEITGAHKGTISKKWNKTQ
ncbi:DUF3987 domain-containing protein [Bizionia sp.]|uniref:DUF3987 domain-containing protein n=1 Tax=Bizionia sp. TaxID=1954480 RepID=UPI003A8E9A8F